MNDEDLKKLLKGNLRILGIDEAGQLRLTIIILSKGPLAGPVVVGGCIFKSIDDAHLLKIRDSKKMSKKLREEMYEYLKGHAHCAVSIQSAAKIDKIGISGATALGIEEVYNKLKNKADITIFDGNWDPIKEDGFHTLVKGDDKVKEISAASIIAKVTHDKILDNYAKHYPEYAFDEHHGYGTKKHRDSIIEHGRCPIHRRSFKVKGYDDDPYRKRLLEEARIRKRMKSYHA